MNVEIDYIAALADLEVPESKKAKFEKDVASILEMLADLPDVSGVDDTLDTTDDMVLRQDVVVASLSREDALQNAPEVEAGCVVVPKTVE